MSDQIKILRKSLSSLGLRLLDAGWQGWHAQYRYRCRRGHEVDATAAHIVYHLRRCPRCREAEALDALHELARQAGGRCLDTHYVGRLARYRFVCREGHEFEKTAPNLHKGSWCVLCARAEHALRMRDPNGMKRLRAVVRGHGGRCLTRTYTKLADRYAFRCVEGHEWTAVGSEVIRGSWCRLCADGHKVQAYRRKDGLTKLHELAAERGGVCLASEYQGNSAYYPFRCAEGHEWETNAARIFRGAWCFICGHTGRRRGLNTMHGLAAAQGGRCLSDAYANNQTQLEWECRRGHRWQATPGAVAAGHWCARCAYDALKLGIERMRSIAVERGGRCISDTYVNSATRLEWECARGHRWMAKPNSIRSGHWCARCHFISMTTNPKTLRERRHEAVRV